ncbi:phosphomannomutase/phosphoglucomutase [Candidatus Babeliales bacterium]|nr:phosphomannomutase/phosphoglucomutase [Candidatus Babeliales bacterium]
MKDNIFREYDIRGIVGDELPIEQTKDLGTAIFTYFLQQIPNLKQIVVAMDGRTHSPEIKNNIIDAATELGLDVLDIGVCPTPTFYFALFNSPASSGMIITASHNPKEYNGIKICLETKSVWGKQIQEIKDIYREIRSNLSIHPTPPNGSAWHSRRTEITAKAIADKQDKRALLFPRSSRVMPQASYREIRTGIATSHDTLSAYISWLSNHFKHLKNSNINAIIDCANGTAGTVFPRLIKSMGWNNVKLLFEEVDGTFPNHEADPTKPKNMISVGKFLEKNKTCDLGIGLDGDCDRMSPMTKTGYLVPGDKLLALYSKKILEKKPNATVVFDIKSSSALSQAIESWGGKPHVAPSGHSIIKQHLREQNAVLAGELSCHFFFNDRYFGYDDGIYATLRLFELLQESPESFDAMLEKLPKKINSPEYRIACSEQEKKSIVDHVKSVFATRTDASLLTIDGIKAETSYGWGLIRASNTQPVVCLRFESDSKDGLDRIQGDFTSALTKYFDRKTLGKYFEN